VKFATLDAEWYHIYFEQHRPYEGWGLFAIEKFKLSTSLRAMSLVDIALRLFILFPRLCRHQFIQLCILWEFVDEWHKRAADFYQPMTRINIRYIRKLKV